ncbi:HNH endonuclease [Pseudomonas sp.]|uniref:HNH endonuclease n=1 Tax=Pseudomonas sp. TaxID=306 RepID=UPI003982D0B6
MTYKTTHFNNTPITYKLVNDGTLAIAEFHYQGVLARILPMFPGYAFTVDGRVLSFKGKTPIYLRPGKTAAGRYCNVSMCCGATVRTQYVHRPICWAFHPNNQKDRTQVNHIDGNPHNNAASNLEWVTPRENLLHASALRAAEGRSQIVLSMEQKRMITTLYAADLNMHAIATLLKLPYDSVRRHINLSKQKASKAA